MYYYDFVKELILKISLHHFLMTYIDIMLGEKKDTF